MVYVYKHYSRALQSTSNVVPRSIPPPDIPFHHLPGKLPGEFPGKFIGKLPGKVADGSLIPR